MPVVRVGVGDEGMGALQTVCFHERHVAEDLMGHTVCDNSSLVGENDPVTYLDHGLQIVGCDQQCLR